MGIVVHLFSSSRIEPDKTPASNSCGSAGADGRFGSSTTSAVKAFQRNTNGLEVDGLVENATKQALYVAVFCEIKMGTEQKRLCPSCVIHIQVPAVHRQASAVFHRSPGR